MQPGCTACGQAAGHALLMLCMYRDALHAAGQLPGPSQGNCYWRAGGAPPVPPALTAAWSTPVLTLAQALTTLRFTTKPTTGSWSARHPPSPGSCRWCRGLTRSSGEGPLAPSRAHAGQRVCCALIVPPRRSRVQPVGRRKRGRACCHHLHHSNHGSPRRRLIESAAARLQGAVCISGDDLPRQVRGWLRGPRDCWALADGLKMQLGSAQACAHACCADHASMRCLSHRQTQAHRPRPRSSAVCLARFVAALRSAQPRPLGFSPTRCLRCLCHQVCHADANENNLLISADASQVGCAAKSATNPEPSTLDTPAPTPADGRFAMTWQVEGGRSHESSTPHAGV
jgi:hypothetical protein